MDFSGLITIEDWTKALEQLMSSATVALQTDNTTKIFELQDDLFNYQQASPPHFDSLDKIAFKLSLELNRANRQTALKNIGDLASELGDLKNLLGVATVHANQAADAIQLKSAKEFLGKAKTSITILKNLRADLSDTNTDLGQKVAAVFKAIQDFEEAFPDA
jgi:hypothetical protein